MHMWDGDANSKEFKKIQVYKFIYQIIQQLWSSLDGGPSWHIS